MFALLSSWHLRAKVLACFALIAPVQGVWAETASRSPAEGIAVLDCAPRMRSLVDACTLRVPPLHQRGQMHKSASDAEGEFNFIRDNDAAFPQGIHVSATMILIDETPGPKGARAKTLPLERSLIAGLIDALPKDELVAVYGFNEAGTLHALADYTVSRKMADDAVLAMQMTGVNTHLATNLRDAINLMAERDDVLFPNIIVVTDGEEEGIPADATLSDLSSEKGVVVSTLGLFWRPEGSAQVGLAKDYLGSRLTTRDFGMFEGVPLNDPAEAKKRVADFALRYTRAIEQSGLIVPVGKPVDTDLVVETLVPVVGTPGATKVVEHVAHFAGRADGAAETGNAETGDAATTGDAETGGAAKATDAKTARAKTDEGASTPAPSTATPAKEADLWWGYPKLWYLYGAAGLGGFLFLLLLILLIVRSPRRAVLDEPLDFLGPDTAMPPAAAPVTQPAIAARPLVVLLREDTRERLVLPMPGGTIGRAPTNQLVLVDDGVSRIHAEIRLNGGAVTLSDAGSLNGTLLNGKILKAAARLKTGDSIGLGNVTLRVTLP